MSLNKAPRDVASYMISEQQFRDSLNKEGFKPHEVEKIIDLLSNQDSYLRKNFKWMRLIWK